MSMPFTVPTPIKSMSKCGRASDLEVISASVIGDIRSSEGGLSGTYSFDL